MLIVHKLSFTHNKLLLTIHDTSHFSWETLPCVIMSWCQQNTYDVTRITRQMIRQLNSHDIYRQLTQTYLIIKML